MKLLFVSIPFHVALLLKLGPRVDENERVIGMNNVLIQDVLVPLLEHLNQIVELLVIGIVVLPSVCQRFWVIRNRMSSMFKNCTNDILRCNYFNLNQSVEIRQAKSRSKAESVFEALELLPSHWCPNESCVNWLSGATISLN